MKNLNILIQQSTEGHEGAQRELYMRYRSSWYMVSMRYGKTKHEADDILQEGLIQIYKDLHQFDSKKSAFNTWSTRLISHAALRYLKKNSWHQAVDELDEASNLADSNEQILDRLSAQELILLVRALPLGYRLVFNMYVMEGFNHREIAQRLEISEGTSKSQLSKARKMLRQKLEAHLIEYTAK